MPRVTFSCYVAVFCSDFQMFTHGYFGNCYVFNAHVEGSEKRIIKRGGTDVGMKFLVQK